MSNVTTRACLVGAFLAGACSSSSSSTPPAPSDGGTTRWRAAVGDGGLVAQTFDDSHWVTRALGTHALASVTCAGNLRGWVAGGGGYVAHTEDGGATFVAQDAHTTADLHAIRFGDGRFGVVAGALGTLAISHDGGASWSVAVSGTTATLRGAAATADGRVAVVVGDGGTVLRSIDGGASFGLTTLSSGADLHGVTMDAGAHEVLAVDASGAVWSSVDLGAAFTQVAAAGVPLDAVSLSDDGERALASGARGTLLVRAGASTWSAAHVPGGEDLHAALATMGGPLYAAGDSSTLVRSDDFGAHWSRVPLPTSAALRALEDL